MAAEVPSSPGDIDFRHTVVDICFHPSKDAIASGSIGGDVVLHSYSCTGKNCELLKFSHHRKACRVLRFSPSGEVLYTASKDKSIHTLDLNTGVLKRKLLKAHDSPIYSMVVSGDNFLATGDDDGHIKLWDLRMQQSVMDLRETEEFVSDMVIDKQFKTLLATSGDGTLTAFNIRQKRMEMQSELFDSEFLSLAIVKQGSKVVCGCGEGEMNIFNWGQWGNISDRFPGHPMSVDCMVPLTQDIVITGSSDGIIRAVNILPNRFLGIVGEHPDELPVENMSLSRDNRFLASCSHDQKVKFWNVEDIKMKTVNERKKAKKKDKTKYLESSSKSDFFAGLAEGEETGAHNSDSSDSEKEDIDDDDEEEDKDDEEEKDEKDEDDDEEADEDDDDDGEDND